MEDLRTLQTQDSGADTPLGRKQLRIIYESPSRPAIKWTVAVDKTWFLHNRRIVTGPAVNFNTFFWPFLSVTSDGHVSRASVFYLILCQCFYLLTVYTVAAIAAK
jgi:hypothetical protein